MRLSSLIVIAAVLTALCSPGWATPPEPMELKARLSVQVDATGKVSAVQLAQKDAKRLAPAVAGPLLADARTWTFTPALRDGQAVPSTTHVLITLRADPVDEDGEAWALRITRATNGPAVESSEPPRYPHVAIRNGAVARVVVEADIAPDGTVAAARVVEVRTQKSRYADDFAQATLASVQQWRFSPEEVAGQPIAGTVRVPTTYCIDGRKCFPMEDSHQPGDGEAIAQAPATRLLTELAGRVL